jgi:hypothetical protein
MTRTRPVIALALLATLAASTIACGGSSAAGDQAGQAATPSPAAAATDAASTSDPGGTATVPTEVPDPCSLLTEDEAFALLTTQTREEYAAQYGTSDFSARLNPSGPSGDPTCEWGNASVQLSVSIIPAGDDPSLLDSYHQQLLDNWSGEMVDGVGDGAKIGGATPVELQAFEGYWQIDLRALVSDTESTPRFATAANLVFQRLAGG